MKQSILVLLSIALITACNSDDDSDNCPITPQIPTNEFFPLKIGNYWVFEFQNRTPDGEPVGSITIDSLIVQGDTLIDDLRFHVLTTNKPSANTTWFLRDSSGYILSRSSLVLPPSPRETIYNEHYGFNPIGDTLYHYYDQFPRTEIVATNFGAESCLTQEATHIPYDILGEEPVVDTSYYARFGPVQRSYGYLSGGKIFGKLIDYHLE